MKKTLIFSFVIMMAIQTWAQENMQALSPGSAAPLTGTKMKSVDGKEFSIKDVTQKNGVLVMFSCNTCPYVKKYQSRTLSALKYARENGIGVIVINSNEGQRNDDDSYAAMQQYAKQQQYQDIPYVVDNNSAVANAFGATRTPECFLFNAKNQLVYHGAIDDNPDAQQAKRNHLKTAIEETVTGKDVSVKETRFVGCGIKRAS